MAVLPPVPVEAPAVQAAPYGLYSVATPAPLGAREWGGIVYQTVCDPQTSIWHMPCTLGDTENPDAKTIPDTLDRVEARPFVVYGGNGCPPIGMRENEAQQWAIDRLEFGEQAAVEAVLWDGSGVGLPGIATSSPTDLTAGTATDPVNALALLEDWIATETYEAGVIHAPRKAGAPLASHNLIDNTVPGVRQSYIGTRFSFGSGYPGTGPHRTGVDPDPLTGKQFWMFATRQVTVRRSAIDVPATWATGAVNLATNATAVLAERGFVVDWACTAAAVLVDPAICPCSSIA